GAAGSDLRGVRLLVDPLLSPRLPVEMFDDIRDVDLGSIDPGLLERAIEECARGADERPSGQVLSVARLLAHEHHGCTPFPLAENGLRSLEPEITGLAVCCSGAEVRQRRTRRNQGSRSIGIIIVALHDQWPSTPCAAAVATCASGRRSPEADRRTHPGEVL